MKRRKLGSVQQAIMDSLERHGPWNRYACGWVWDTIPGTERRLQRLVKLGYVESYVVKNDRGERTYYRAKS